MDECVEKLESGKLQVSEFVAQAFNQSDMSAQDALDLLNARSRELDNELRTAVCSNSDDLLRNATDVKYLRDNVSTLKEHISKTRSDTYQLAATIIDPFREVQRSTQQLDASYAICEKMRILLKFLGLVKQTKTTTRITRITGISGDIRRLCIMKQIADGGQLNKIEAFQKFWKLYEPICNQMITIADSQLNSALTSSDVNSAIPTISIFLHLGGKYTNDVTYGKCNQIIIACKEFTRSKLDKSTCDTIIPVLNEILINFRTGLSKINTLHQAIESAISKFSEQEIIDFNTSKISPTIVLTNYSTYFKETLELTARQNPTLSTKLMNEIPNIRKSISSSISEYPRNIDSRLLFMSLTNVFSNFQEPYLQQAIRELRQRFISLFSEKQSIDSNRISLFFETTSNKLSKYDQDLLQLFESSLLKMAEDFDKLKNHKNTVISTNASSVQDSVLSNFYSFFIKLYPSENIEVFKSALKM